MSAAPGTRPPALRRVLDLVVSVVDRAVVEPVRAGRLRSDGWPVGLRTVITVTLVCYGLLALVTVAGPWVRRALPAGSSLFGIAPELLGVATAVTALLAAVVATAGLHAPPTLRVAGLAAPLLLWSSQVWLATEPAQLLWTAAGLVGMLALNLLRAGRRFVWWEPLLAVLVVGGVTLANLVAVVRPAVDAGTSDPSLLVVTTVMSVGALGLGYTVTSGAAVSEVAMSTSAWFVEQLSRRFSRRTQTVVVLVLVVLAWTGLVLALRTSAVPAPRVVGGVLISVSLVGATLVCWLLLDHFLDRRDARAGTRPGATDLDDVADAFRQLAVGVGLALATPHAANMVWANLERGLQLPLSLLGVDHTPASLADRYAGGPLGWLSLELLGPVFAVLLCAVTVVRATLARRRGAAELALVVGLFCAMFGLDVLGVPFVAADPDTLATATLAIVTVLGGWWLLTRRLTTPRLHAVGVATLLAGAISARDLLSDPLGWLLGSAGGALLVLGLLWNLLTGAEEANGDSRRFPRASRTLVVVGYLTVAMTVAATDALAVSFDVDLDRFVELGARVVGTALLATATWAVLGTGVRNEPTVEPDWR